MNAAEYIILALLALLALGLSVLASAVRGVQTRLDTLEGASVDDKKSIEDSRAIIDKHAGDFVRIQHRIAALEGPRHLIGRFGTHEGKDGQPRAVYLYHVSDNEWTMAEYGAQAVVWQTAMNPVVALELLSTGAWSGVGVLGPEALPSEPFLDLLKDGYGQEWKMEDRT